MILCSVLVRFGSVTHLDAPSRNEMTAEQTTTRYHSILVYELLSH